ncbi:unnamed protein product, partial [marine sediment metagenome]
MAFKHISEIDPELKNVYGNKGCNLARLWQAG